MRHLQRGVGSEPEGTVLHERDVLGDPRAPELHEVRAARRRVHEVAVEARCVRAAGLQPRAVPRARPRQVPGVSGGLGGEEPNAILDVPPL